MEKFTQLENFLHDFGSRQISSLAFCFNRFHGKNSLSTFVARSNFVLQSLLTLPIWLEIAFELWRGQRPTDAISRIVVLSSCCSIVHCSGWRPHVLQRGGGIFAKYHPLLQLQHHSTLTIKQRVPPKKGAARNLRAVLGDQIFGPIWIVQVIWDHFGQYQLFWATLDHFGPLWPKNLISEAVKVLKATFFWKTRIIALSGECRQHIQRAKYDAILELQRSTMTVKYSTQHCSLYEKCIGRIFSELSMTGGCHVVSLPA